MPHFGEKNVSCIGCVASPPSASSVVHLVSRGDVGGFVVHVDALDAPVAAGRVVRSHEEASTDVQRRVDDQVGLIRWHLLAGHVAHAQQREVATEDLVVASERVTA